MPICNKLDYKTYRLEDIKNYVGEIGYKQWIIDDIYRWTWLLRKTEYFVNCKKSITYQPYIFFLKTWFMLLSRKLGYSIALNTCGPGLSIAHRGTIVINEGVKIGNNCRIHVCVNIGMLNGTPKIGHNVYIGPGAKVFGGITIGDGVAIGANAVVNKSIPPNVTVAGVPAKTISKRGSHELIPALRKKLN